MSDRMIPKIIHYCWFGGNSLPQLAKECIESWKRFFPDYEIWEWNESNFDVNIIPYTKEAYKQKKYAYVSDFARFWILYRYGGLYFDTDVEVIRPFNSILNKGNFLGFEVDPDGENSPKKYAPKYAFAVAPGLGMGMNPRHPFLQKMIEYYQELNFDGGKMSPWQKTIVAYTTEVLVEMGLENKQGEQELKDLTIYPHEYFAPINVITGKLRITQNTYSIHHYMGSWNESHSLSFRTYFKQWLPECILIAYNNYKRRNYRIE